MAGWDDVPDASAKPAATAKGWGAVPDAKAPALDFQDTPYGFKAAKGEAPTGGPATIRDDGAVNFPGQSNWLFYDPKSKQYAPAPSEPWKNKGMIGSALGSDTLSHYGRNLAAGFNSAVEGVNDIGSSIGNRLGIIGDKTHSDNIRRINEGFRQKQALANTGGPTASTAQFIGETAPIVAGTAVASPVLAAGLPGAMGSVASPLALGLSTATMTPGTMQDRAQAGALAASTAAALPFAFNKVVKPIISTTGEAIGTAFPKVGAVARSVADKLGLPTTTPNESMDPKSILQKFLDRVKGKPSDVVQEELATKYATDRAEAGAPFQNLRANGGVVSMDPYVAQIDKTIEEVNKSGFRDKAGLIKELAGFRDVATEAPVTWNKALDIGTDINHAISDAMHGAEPNRNLARILSPLKTAHQAALDQAGSAEGQAYQAAKAGWAEKIAPWEDPEKGGKILKQFLNSPTPDSAMDALLKAKSEDKVGYFIDQLKGTKNGIPALQAGLAQAVYDQSLNDMGTKVIPSKFIGALNQRADAYGLAFTGEDKWVMDGLKTLMNDSRFLANTYSGAAIKSALPGNRVLNGSVFPTPDAGSTIQKLLTSPLGRKLLMDVSTFKPGSAAVGNVINTQIPRVLGASAPSVSPTNITPLQLPKAAGEPNPQVAQEPR